MPLITALAAPPVKGLGIFMSRGPTVFESVPRCSIVTSIRSPDWRNVGGLSPKPTPTAIRASPAMNKLYQLKRCKKVLTRL
jgi:hypothetical protein